MATLDEFFAALDRYDDRVPLDELEAHLRALEISRDDYAHVVRFNDDHYTRNMLREGSGYQALILCWTPSQRSPIHDHRGSSCGVRVLEGTCTEVQFTLDEHGVPVEGGTCQLPEGGICGSQDSDIHEVLNEDDANPLITMHIYSPPLANYRRFERGVGETEVVGHVPLEP